MANTNLTTVARAAERAMLISREGTDDALVAAAPVIAQSYQAYKAADGMVDVILDEEHEKRGKRDETRRTFGRSYDKTLSSIRVHKPEAELPGRASSATTLDDLVNNGKKMVIILKKVAGVDETHPVDGQGEAAPTGEPWAIPLLQGFLAELAAAEGVLNDSALAGHRLQIASDDRAGKREDLEKRLIAYGRLVRDVYGRHSRQYHSLHGRAANGTDEDENPTPTPPAVQPATLALASAPA